MAMEVATRRFNVDEYHKMAEIGVLKPYERVELLDGKIYFMETNGEQKRFTFPMNDAYLNVESVSKTEKIPSKQFPSLSLMVIIPSGFMRRDFCFGNYYAF